MLSRYGFYISLVIGLMPRDLSWDQGPIVLSPVRAHSKKQILPCWEYNLNGLKVGVETESHSREVTVLEVSGSARKGAQVFWLLVPGSIKCAQHYFYKLLALSSHLKAHIFKVAQEIRTYSSNHIMWASLKIPAKICTFNPAGNSIFVTLFSHRNMQTQSDQNHKHF